MASMTRVSGRGLATLLPVLEQSPRPRYSALANAIAILLQDGRLAPGTTLPSERELAGALHLSRATVTAAYDVLRAERIVISRIGSGSVTALPAQLREPQPPNALGHPLLGRSAQGHSAQGHSAQGHSALARSALARSAHGRPARGAGDAGSWADTPPAGPWNRRDAEAADRNGRSQLIDMSSAVFPAPPQLLPAVSRATARLPAFIGRSGYEPAGIIELRQAIADRFTDRGVPTEADQILVTNGALHATDLVLRLLVGPGDRVLTELPTYSGMLDAVRASGARTLAVPVDPLGGWQVAPIVAAIRQGSPRLAVLMPDFHNPTGFLAPDADRVEVLRAARRSGTTVLVDESFIGLGFVPPATPAAALDPSVITVGSLSKPIWGGLRVGWIRATRETIQRVAVVRAAMDMGQSILEQLVALELLPELTTIMANRCRDVEPRRDHLIGALGRQLPTWRTSSPDGGLFLWVELDAPRATPLTMRAAQYGVRIVAGSRFGVDGTMERFLRLPFVLPAETLAIVVDRLASAWHDLGPTTDGYPPLIVA